MRDIAKEIIRVEHGVKSLGSLTAGADPYTQSTQFGAVSSLYFPGDIDESVKVFALAYGDGISVTSASKAFVSTNEELDVFDVGDVFTYAGSGVGNDGDFTVATKTDANNLTVSETVTADESANASLTLTTDNTSDLYVTTRTWNQVHDRKSMTNSGYARVYGFGGSYGIGERPNPYNDTFTLADVYGGAQIAPWTNGAFASLDTPDTVDGFVDNGGTTADFSFKLTTTDMSLKQICAYMDALAMQTTDVDEHGTNEWFGERKDTLYTLDTDGKVVFMQGLYPTIVPVADRANVILVEDDGTSRYYQSVAGGIIDAGSAAKADTNAWYQMFYLDGQNLEDFNTLDAVTVNDNSGTPIKGNVATDSDADGKISFDFAYSTNTQTGYSGGTDREVVVLVEGDGGCKAKKVLGTITDSTSLVFTCQPDVEDNI